MLFKNNPYIEIEPSRFEKDSFGKPMFLVWYGKSFYEDYIGVTNYLTAEEIGQLMGGS